MSEGTICSNYKLLPNGLYIVEDEKQQNVAKGNDLLHGDFCAGKCGKQSKYTANQVFFGKSDDGFEKESPCCKCGGFLICDECWKQGKGNYCPNCGCQEFKT